MTEYEKEIRDCLEKGLFVDPFAVRHLLREVDTMRTIIDSTLRVLPVGNVVEHTPESIPGRVDGWLKELADSEANAHTPDGVLWSDISEMWRAKFEQAEKRVSELIGYEELLEALCRRWEEYSNDEHTHARKLQNAGNGYAAAWHRDVARSYEQCVEELRRALALNSQRVSQKVTQ